MYGKYLLKVIKMNLKVRETEEDEEEIVIEKDIKSNNSPGLFILQIWSIITGILSFNLLTFIFSFYFARLIAQKSKNTIMIYILLTLFDIVMLYIVGYIFSIIILIPIRIVIIMFLQSKKDILCNDTWI